MKTDIELMKAVVIFMEQQYKIDKMNREEQPDDDFILGQLDNSDFIKKSKQFKDLKDRVVEYEERNENFK